MDELLADFITETRETLEAIAGELVAWEANPGDRSRLDGIFRFVHTVKGSCGFLDLPRLLRLSHAAEDALADARSGDRVADARLVSAVLAIIDRIGELTAALETGEPLADGDDHPLIEALSAVQADEPAEAAARLATGSNPVRTVARSIRLSVDLLDRMMAGVSDMVLARNELSRALREGDKGGSVDLAFERLSLCVGEMRDAITRTRMARIDHLFTALPRMVRDLAGQLGKSVQLEVDGGDVELDREMIEMIRDPLTHIVRNAIDHGIEMPEARMAAGKPATGRLRISARQSGNQILIDAVDDGAGIDGDRLVRKAVAAGTLSADQAALLTPKRKLELIFQAGLSTAETVSDISGRGVGMDVVRANIERIGGTVDVDSRPGQGLRLSMRVPLTLTIIPALIVASGPHRFALPRSAIDEIVRPNGTSVRVQGLGSGRIACVRGRNLPVVDLGGFLGCGSGEDGASWSVLVVLRAGTGESFALSVDAVLDHEELVVKPAAPAVMATGIYAGTTLPDSSRPMLLLDVAGIAAQSGILGGAAEAQAVEEPTQVASNDNVTTLLFRDLDGVERGVRLGLVERIEDVERGQIALSGGRLLLAHQGSIVPVAAAGSLPAQGRVRLLQLGDGTGRLAYPIANVIDVMDLPPDFAPAATPGRVAGVALVEGRQVELLDSYWLFGEALDAPAAEDATFSVLAEDDPWARQVLAPLLAAAGYHVRFGEAAADERIDAVIATGAGRAPARAGAPVLRLRHTATPAGANDTSIWRYDRAGLLDALKMVAGGRR